VRTTAKSPVTEWHSLHLGVRHTQKNGAANKQPTLHHHNVSQWLHLLLQSLPSVIIIINISPCSSTAEDRYSGLQAATVSASTSKLHKPLQNLTKMPATTKLSPAAQSVDTQHKSPTCVSYIATTVLMKDIFRDKLLLGTALPAKRSSSI
jgi:hypothetical protein